ncbi:MAG: hypothetical protein CBD34_02040 [Rickettsiales bacterium TMED174]|jgi:hypothetical protein|nr:MAG: hypothetical protein CBD34_02040 [Rickettsiales bacterium TMED174]|tara:strand:- start:58 stop:627 length:570 start_codon:yes stop_codon:yes gene_type:complete
MPNWCNNNIEIRGPKNKLEKIQKAAKDGKMLNHFHPMPAELSETTANGTQRPELEKKYGFSDWYGWANNNWGTKWDNSEVYGDCELKQDGKEYSLDFAFDTAWAPPIGAVEKYLEENEDVSIKLWYFEGGMDFMGVYYDGEDEEYTISDVTDEELESNMKEFEEQFNILESREMYREELKEQEEEEAHG